MLVLVTLGFLLGQIVSICHLHLTTDGREPSFVALVAVTYFWPIYLLSALANGPVHYLPESTGPGL